MSVGNGRELGKYWEVSRGLDFGNGGGFIECLMHECRRCITEFETNGLDVNKWDWIGI